MEIPAIANQHQPSTVKNSICDGYFKFNISFCIEEMLSVLCFLSLRSVYIYTSQGVLPS